MKFIELRNELAEFYEVFLPMFVFVIVFISFGSFIDSMIQKGYIIGLFIGIVAQLLLTIIFVSYILKNIDEDN